MKALTKIASIVIIIACGGSLMFAFKLSNTKAQLRADKEQLKAQTVTLGTNLTKAQAEASKADEDKRKAQAEAAETAKSLEATKTEVADKSRQIDDLKGKAQAAEQEATDTKTKLASAEDANKKLQEVTESPEFKNAENLSKQAAALNAESKLIGDQLAAERAKSEQLTKNLQLEHATPVGLHGRVALARSPWNFIILDVGDAEHVRENTEFLIYRDKKFVAKARVTIVRPNSSVAELEPGFTKIQPREGDVVVSQGKM